MVSQWKRNGLLYVLIGFAILAVFFLFLRPTTATQEATLGEVISLAEAGQVRRIEVDGINLRIETRDGSFLTAQKEEESSIVELLQRQGVAVGNGPNAVDIAPQAPNGMGTVFGVLLNFLPLILFGGLILFMMRQAQSSGNQTLGFGRSKAKMFVADRPGVTFDDVAGADESKQDLQELVEFLKSPEKFTALGAHIPKGTLLVGPPGTGKTLLSRAVAGEAGVPFFAISGSEFVEMFVGVGASRVRDLFDQAKRNSPAIVFIDEIDAVGRQRGAGLGGGHDEREQTLNQILVEMDGFETGTNVIIIAATNRPDILDHALLRPGRFDRRVALGHPDSAGRMAILQIHTKGKPLDSNVDLRQVARMTAGFTGADLANLVNEAAIQAARSNKQTVSAAEFNEAIDRVLLGPERKSRVITPKEKQVTAFHEAGHALTAWLLPNADTVQKISIVARGMAGGYTKYLPDEDRNLWTKSQFQDALSAALGGRVAEEITFEEITTGASNDLQQATRIARQMITHYGMSKRLGPRTFGKHEELVFLGREITEQRDYSDRVAQEIDDEVHDIIEEAYTKAKDLLTSHQAKLNDIAHYLIDHETLEGETLEKVFNAPVAKLGRGKKPKRPIREIQGHPNTKMHGEATAT